MKKFINPIIITISLIFIISCTKKIEQSGIVKTKYMIIYTCYPYNSPEDITEQGSEIAFFDITQKKTSYITKNQLADKYPKISPSGNYILYTTNEERNANKAEIIGLSGNQDIYLYDIVKNNSEKMEIFAPNISIKEVNWFKDDSNLVLLTYDNIVYSYNITNKKLSQIFCLPDWELVYSLTLSDDGKNMAFIFSRKQTYTTFGMGVLNLPLQKLDTIDVVGLPKSWSGDNRLLFTEKGQIKEYEISNKVIKNITDNAKFDKILFKSAFYMNSNTLIGLACQVNNDEEKPNEVYLYDINQKEITWLTNDKIYKEDFQYKIRK